MTDFDAEELLVSALLRCDARTGVRLLSRLAPADFADPVLASLARAEREVAQSGLAPEPSAVFAHLRATFGPAQAHPLVVRLSALVVDGPSGSMAARFAALVVEGAVRRAAIAAATKLTQAADGHIDQLLDVWQELAESAHAQAGRFGSTG